MTEKSKIYQVPKNIEFRRKIAEAIVTERHFQYYSTHGQYLVDLQGEKLFYLPYTKEWGGNFYHRRPKDDGIATEDRKDLIHVFWFVKDSNLLHRRTGIRDWEIELQYRQYTLTDILKDWIFLQNKSLNPDGSIPDWAQKESYGAIVNWAMNSEKYGEYLKVVENDVFDRETNFFLTQIGDEIEVYE